MKCIVDNCPNHNHQGYGFTLLIKDLELNKTMLKFICSPCMITLINGKEINSQLYRNINNSKEN